jgi:hypothetical protein
MWPSDRVIGSPECPPMQLSIKRFGWTNEWMDVSALPHHLTLHNPLFLIIAYHPYLFYQQLCHTSLCALLHSKSIIQPFHLNLPSNYTSYSPPPRLYLLNNTHLSNTI